jgi:hypothetical protein
VEPTHSQTCNGAYRGPTQQAFYETHELAFRTLVSYVTSSVCRLGSACLALAEGLVGLESQSGVVRAEPPRVRVGRGNDYCVAKKLGVHRRIVRGAIGNALPRLRKKAKRRRWKMDAAAAFVDAILEAARKAPRKQRHTAQRIWQRISALLECQIGNEPSGRTCSNGKLSWG